MLVCKYNSNIENNFKSLQKQIRENYQKKQINVSLFSSFDSEFSKLENHYSRDLKNQLHIKHNYLSTKSIQYITTNSNKSLKYFLSAFFMLTKRHLNCQYPDSALKKMVNSSYGKLISEIDKSINNNCDFKEIKEDVLKLINNLIIRFCHNDTIKNMVSKIVYMCFKKYSKFVIEEIKIKSFEDYQQIEKEIVDFKKGLEKLKEFCTYNKLSYSLLCEIIYKIRKKQLYYLVRIVYFEKEFAERLDFANKQIKIVINDMDAFSKASFRYAKSSDELDKNDDNVKLMLTLKEIDIYTAGYYREAYLNKNSHKAWIEISRIKHFLIKKAFQEKIRLSEEILNYYSDEFNRLNIFAKLSLLKQETIKTSCYTHVEFLKDLFLDIKTNLENIEKNFFLEENKANNNILEISSSSFTGSFSEYFVHHLFLKFYEFNGEINESILPSLKELLSIIKTLKSKEDIVLNDIFRKGCPDIDINLKGKTYVFLKNTKMQENEMETFENEVKLCTFSEYSFCFYGINFMKNINQITYIQDTIQRIEKENNITVYIFDIKDLIQALFKGIEKNKSHKFNFSSSELLRLFGY